MLNQNFIKQLESSCNFIVAIRIRFIDELCLFIIKNINFTIKND